jgi:hypothetical protein
VKRADEDIRPGLITSQLIRDINDASLIVADLSELNANAFYELGVGHALNKKTIHICDKATKLPFDVKQYRTIFFDTLSTESHQMAIDRMREQEKFLASSEVWETPVISVLGEKKVPDLTREQSFHLALGAHQRLDQIAWDCLICKNNWAGTSAVHLKDANILLLKVKFPITDRERSDIYAQLVRILPPNTQFAIEVVGDDGRRLFADERAPEEPPGWSLRTSEKLP